MKRGLMKIIKRMFAFTLILMFTMSTLLAPSINLDNNGDMPIERGIIQKY